MTYQLKDGAALVVSVDGGRWATLKFAAGDFADPKAATARELATVINRDGALAASVDTHDHLVLSTPSRGANATMDFDAQASTAAAALGLAGHLHNQGTGLQTPRLTGLTTEPFRLAAGAEMTIEVDGRRRRMVFDQDATRRPASADDVAAIINSRSKGLAWATRDGRVALGGTTIGPDARLEVRPGPSRKGRADAAHVLGFEGAAAVSQPHNATPARVVAQSTATDLRVVNLTPGPIQLHFVTGTVLLPSRGSLALSAQQVADAALQRLVGQGAVRLVAGAY